MTLKELWAKMLISLATLLLAACGATPMPETIVVEKEVTRVVEVEKEVTVEVVVLKEVTVEVTVEKEVTRVVEVEKEVTIEVVVEVPKVIEVEKVVTATPEPFMPTPVPQTPRPTHWLGEYQRTIQARVSSQRFVGGWMFDREGETTAIYGRDTGTSFTAPIVWNESDGEYPDVPGCPIKHEGQLGPRYGFGKFWCQYADVRAHLIEPENVGQTEWIEMAEYSNGYSLFIPQYGRGAFEIHNDGRWRRVAQ